MSSLASYNWFPDIRISDILLMRVMANLMLDIADVFAISDQHQLLIYKDEHEQIWNSVVAGNVCHHNRVKCFSSKPVNTGTSDQVLWAFLLAAPPEGYATPKWWRWGRGFRFGAASGASFFGSSKMDVRPPSAADLGQIMTYSKSNSLGAAVGMNLLLPGLGYLYMGRWIAGVLGGALVIAICVRSPSEHLLIVWAATNLIMAIDMCLLGSRHHAKT
ncbi:hypothetical protein [Pseudomonas silesiensis]|uniref:hypothetical protein n=1 Tax=Pseudomonas silesiensis TaxID=1853130 RepID=UPI0034D55F75